PGIVPAILKSYGQMVDVPKISVVAEVFSRQQGVHGMVEVVAPLRVHSDSESLGGRYCACVIQIALRDQVNLAIEPGRQCRRSRRHFGQKRKGTRIEDTVNRVEPKGV